MQTVRVVQSDEALMLLYQQGDIVAFETLVLRYHRKVQAFAAKMLRSVAQAEEVASETFLRLHKAAPTYEAQGRFTTFLFAIAYRESVNVLRRQKGRVSAVVGQSDDCAAFEAISSDCDPEEQAVQRQSLRVVDAILKELPVKQRAVFLLYHREGLATSEIAQSLDIPPSSVRVYLVRARKALRQALQKSVSESGSLEGR